MVQHHHVLEEMTPLMLERLFHPGPGRNCVITHYRVTYMYIVHVRACIQILYKLSSMAAASSVSLMSCSVSIRVLQVTGCFPFPHTHCVRISTVISTASNWYWETIALTTDPSSSFSNMTPRFLQSVPTFFVMSMMAPVFVRKQTSLGSVGFSSDVEKKISKL